MTPNLNSLFSSQIVEFSHPPFLLLTLVRFFRNRLTFNALTDTQVNGCFLAQPFPGGLVAPTASGYGGHSPLYATDNPKSQRKKKMEQQTKSTVPRWYWVIAALALLWNLLGCFFLGIELFAQEQMMQAMTEPQKEWARSIPDWIYFVYGVAVLTGVAGSIGLFLRKSWATLMFAISLVAVIVQMVYTMIIGGGLQAMGPSGLVMPALVIAIAAALLWFSRFARRRIGVAT